MLDSSWFLYLMVFISPTYPVDSPTEGWLRFFFHSLLS